MYLFFKKLCPSFLALCFTLIADKGSAQQQQEQQDELQEAISQEGEDMLVASSSSVRRFHEVLNELLAEFGYDVKSGDIKGLKNLSIRKVRVSEAIPNTYESYLGLLVAEQIKAHSKGTLINCLQCSVKSSTLVEGKIRITSPETNIGQLKEIANQLGIDHFMDVMMVYHTTHMVLAFQIFDVTTGELAWARTYNSETVRSRFQKLAIDYSQVAKSRPTDEYEPEFRYLFGLGAAGLPNVAGTSQDNSMLAVHFRATEKFDNRKHEFGLMLNIFKTMASISKEYPSTEAQGELDTAEPTDEDLNSDTETITVVPAQPQPFETALSLSGTYSYNFLGPIESYDSIRHGISFSGGLLLASGYVAPKLRLGWEIYLGRSFVATLGLDYIGASEIIVDEENIATKGGSGFDAAVAYNL